MGMGIRNTIDMIDAKEWLGLDRTSDIQGVFDATCTLCDKLLITTTLADDVDISDSIGSISNFVTYDIEGPVVLEHFYTVHEDKLIMEVLAQ